MFVPRRLGESDPSRTHGLSASFQPIARQPGADRRLCPYREHTLISQQEHEAWDVLLACQGQLHLAPSGHVIGINMQAALQLASARDYDLAVLSELVPAAEAGLIDTCRRGWPD